MKTSDFVKGLIVGFMDQGFSSRKAAGLIENLIHKYSKQNQMIDENLQSEFLISHMTCSRIFNQFADTLTYDDKRSYNSSVPNYTQEEKTEIAKKVEQNIGLSLKEMAENININPQQIHFTRFSEILKEQGIKCYKQPKTIGLTEEHCQQRLQFANSVQRWTKKWFSVIFSDECQLSIEPNNVYYYTSDQSNITNDLKKIKTNFPLKVHVWGVVSYEKPLFLKRIEGNLNSDGYIQILKEFIEQNQQFKNDYLFQQDNAAIHTAKKVSEFLENEKIELLIWPPKSPDISPIENVWGVLKNLLWKQRESINNQNDLFTQAQTLFFNSEIIQKTITNSYQKLQNRIKQIIKEEGDMS
ncbi:hypothetical protein ABPG72_022842 [Tetrahymena utriculariae]